MLKSFRFLIALLLGLSALLFLSGCFFDIRKHLESRTTALSEVYPTKKVSDLFQKFPEGFTIYHNETEDLPDQYTYHYITLRGNPADRTITGEYRRSVLGGGEETVPIVYTDADGIQATEPYEFSDFAQNIRFLFTFVEITPDLLSEWKLENWLYSPPTTMEVFSVQYSLKTGPINNYLNLEGEKILLSIGSNETEKTHPRISDFEITVVAEADDKRRVIDEQIHSGIDE